MAEKQRNKLKKYIIEWNAGYGTNYDVINADSMREAEIIAQEACQEEVDMNITYDAHEWTQELEDELL